METTIQKITNRLADLRKQLMEFLEKYSNVTRSIFPGSGFISTGGDYSFVDLAPEAISIQDKLFKYFNTYMDTLEVLMVNSPKQHKSEIENERNKIQDYILQNKMTWNKDIQEVIEDTNQSFQKVIDLLLLIFPRTNLNPILVPDTSALYHKIDIEKWGFKEFEKFTIILTPSVLNHLDKHKIEHRNETVRNKSNKLIKKLKEYRRRGKLIEGVTIVKNKIDLRAVGAEPAFDKTLKWLDAGNDDDRLIAETLEIMRNFCDRPVILVTTDINLQNKCDVADLAFIEPPD